MASDCWSCAGRVSRQPGGGDAGRAHSGHATGVDGPVASLSGECRLASGCGRDHPGARMEGGLSEHRALVEQCKIQLFILWHHAVLLQEQLDFTEAQPYSSLDGADRKLKVPGYFGMGIPGEILQFNDLPLF